MNTAILDIETTGLSAVGEGVLLVAILKPYRKAPTVYRVDEYTGPWEPREVKMLNDLLAGLAEYHCIVGHNIKNFDWPFLRSRAHVLGVPFIRPPLYYDTLTAARRVNWLTRRNSFGKPIKALDHLIDFLGIEQEKTKIYPRQWWKAVWSSTEERTRAMNEITAHCISDVRMTEQLYEALLADDDKATVKRF